MKLKYIFSIPLLIYQGKMLNRTALRLPEAKGKRFGQLPLTSNASSTGNNTIIDNMIAYSSPSSLNIGLDKHKVFNLMMVGDSSAAGVGVQSQDKALMGQLLRHLQTAFASSHAQLGYTCVNWQLHASSGHTSYDVLHRLYALPKADAAIDVMVIVVGVNDTTRGISPKTWRHNLVEIITIAKRKFGAKHILFCCLPPMALMPALPVPLNGFIGAKAERLDNVLQLVCEQTDDVDHVSVDFLQAICVHENYKQADFGNEIDAKDMFAEDGFHPNATAYEYWGQVLARRMLDLLR